MRENNVYLSIEEEDIETGLCILDRLNYSTSDETDSLYLQFDRNKSRLTITQDPGDRNVINLPIFHSANCPARKYTQELGNTLTIPKLIKIQAIAVIISHDDKVLLLRKTNILDLFPKSWVFPGGKTMHRENPFERAAKEANMQTGIPFKISHDGIYYNSNLLHVQPLFVYESVTPNNLDFGLPRSQVLNVFYRFRIPINSRDIALSINQGEIDYATWISKDI